jgi:hypothetical protein
MPRGRPKGSKNKSPTSSSRKGMAATPTQLASLVKARAVRAKQRTYFPALPEGGFKALSTPARMSARTAAYKKFSKKMLSGANKMMPSIAYGSISTAYPVSYSGKPIKARKPRLPKNASGKLNAAVNQVVAAVKKVKKAATEKQLAALAKARAARAAKRGGSRAGSRGPTMSYGEWF